MKEMVAYDYDKQSWVTDHSEAVRLHRQHISADIAALEGPNGKHYAQLLGIDRLARLACQKATLELPELQIEA